jgi:hypothetical protein
MLERLQSAAEENVGDLHGYWHERMEPSKDRRYRDTFFSDVTKRARAASHLCICFGSRLKFLTAQT